MADNIKQLIENKYNEAYKTNSLFFNDVETITKTNSNNGMMYWIRFAPSLLVKPERGDTPSNEDPLAKHEPELLVLPTLGPQLSDDDFKLVLNKFPVMPFHTLLITNKYIDQKSLLTPTDLYTCSKLLTQMNNNNDGNTPHLIIYNSGPHSGSSQNHKHLQLLQFPSDGTHSTFIPFQDRLCNDKQPFIPTKDLTPLQDKLVPFAHFVVPLPANPSMDHLMTCYVSLLQYILPYFKGSMHPSYNFILTEKWMCLVPRSNIRAKSLPVGFNSIGYVGLVMIKELQSLNIIKQNPNLIDQLLLECGFPQ